MPLGGEYNGEEHVFDTTSSSGGFFSSSRSSPKSQTGSGFDPNNERFSRKVFVGGLPPDIDEDEITASFRRFGPLVVDWPHKAESKSYFPPKGYAFLLFQVHNRCFGIKGMHSGMFPEVLFPFKNVGRQDDFANF